MVDDVKSTSGPTVAQANKVIEKIIKDKDIKELKEFKEKPEKHEHKEKPEKHEHKEKPEKHEHKEKPEKFEHKEHKDFKEFKVEGLEKDISVEGPGIFNPGDPIEQRVAALEQSLSHFISTNQRPDLSRGALAAEHDTKK